MQKPTDILNPIKTRGDFRQLSERSKQEQPLLSELPPDHPIWDLWLIMMGKYGAQWTHGDEPNMGWIHALRDMHQEELMKGVNNLVHREDNHWPPNAEEFADLCRTSFTWETQAHRVVEHAQLEDLTAKEKRQAAGIEAIRKLREETGI